MKYAMFSKHIFTKTSKNESSVDCPSCKSLLRKYFFWWCGNAHYVIKEMFKLLPFTSLNAVVTQILHTFVTHLLYKIPF